MREGTTVFIEWSLHKYIDEKRVKDELFSDCIARLIGFDRQEKA